MIVTTAVWAGAKLADVLELIGVPKCSRVTSSGGKHVEFVSIDKCKVLNNIICSASFVIIYMRRSSQVQSAFAFYDRKRMEAHIKLQSQ